MNILNTQYTLKYQSLDIFISGCKGNPYCKNCFNPESWNFNQGTVYDDLYFTQIKNKIEIFDKIVENIMVFGGEPLDSNHQELLQMLIDLKTLNKKIWLFTRYSLNEIPNNIKRFSDYIKCGRYIEELKTDDNIQYNIKLASSNQQIFKKDIDF